MFRGLRTGGMRFCAFAAALTLVLSISGCQDHGLRNGDLLFFAPIAEAGDAECRSELSGGCLAEDCDGVVDGGSGAQSMDSAIQDATGQGYIHVGIVEVDEDGLAWIIEATPRLGVHRSCIDSSWFEAQKADGYRVDAKRLKGCETLNESVLRAKALIGRPYDFTFLPGCEALYCSELVYESYLNADGSHIFSAASMNFLSEDGSLNRYWTELFAGLGMSVPQGLPGTNPQDMSQDPALRNVRF
jgi:hypothetical protein